MWFFNFKFVVKKENSCKLFQSQQNDPINITADDLWLWMLAVNYF